MVFQTIMPSSRTGRLHRAAFSIVREGAPAHRAWPRFRRFGGSIEDEGLHFLMLISGLGNQGKLFISYAIIITPSTIAFANTYKVRVLFRHGAFQFLSCGFLSSPLPRDPGEAGYAGVRRLRGIAWHGAAPVAGGPTCAAHSGLRSLFERTPQRGARASLAPGWVEHLQAVHDEVVGSRTVQGLHNLAGHHRWRYLG